MIQFPRLEIITGAMFTGKSNELISRLNKYKYLLPKREIYLFKSEMHSYVDSNTIKSHDGLVKECIDIKNANSIWKVLSKKNISKNPIIGIDEAQFIEGLYSYTVNYLLPELKAFVIISGLSRDSEGNLFGDLPYLLAAADHITALSGICSTCGLEATQTQYLGETKTQVCIDTGENYTIRCNKCWERK